MRHDPASGAIIIMLRSLKMHGMAQAVTDLMEQGVPAFDAAVPVLAQLLKAETGRAGGALHCLSHEGRPLPSLQGPVWLRLRRQ